MKKSELILNILTLLVIVGITITCIWIGFTIVNSDKKVYVQTWTCPETGVNYIITGNSIIEMRNFDGTLYKKP